MGVCFTVAFPTKSHKVAYFILTFTPSVYVMDVNRFLATQLARDIIGNGITEVF
jgi:hypothetical protein